MIVSVSLCYLCQFDIQQKLVAELLHFGAISVESESGICLEIGNRLVRRIERLVPKDVPFFQAAKVYFFDDAFLAVEGIKKIDVDLLVIDERNWATKTEDVLSLIRQTPDPKHHFTARKMIVVLANDRETYARSFVLGGINIRKILVEPKDSVALFGFVVAALTEFRREYFKTSLCVSGGGLDGYIYSLGVCHAIDDCCEEFDCRDFDLYCGVSSGAMLCTSFAAGIDSKALVAQIYGQRGVLDPLTIGTVFDFAGTEFVKRFIGVIRGFPYLDTDGFLSRLKQLVPVGFFKGDKLKQFIARQLEIAGQPDQLDKLQKPVYISVTDQDTGEHVTFGEAPWQSISISQAVRASTALPPFYLPESIKGHWFTDGQLTSNSDFNTAIRKGAGLVVLIDPMVPFTSHISGHVLKFGGYFAAIQAIKSLVHSRFKSVLKHAMDMAPEVDFVVFKPSETAMIAMAGNPMGANIKSELERIGHQATITQILDQYDAVKRKFAKHGIGLRSKAEIEALLDSK